MARKTNIKTATIVLPADEPDTARRLSAILAGEEPRVSDGRLFVHVPLERLEAALIFDYNPLKP